MMTPQLKESVIEMLSEPAELQESLDGRDMMRKREKKILSGNRKN